MRTLRSSVFSWKKLPFLRKLIKKLPKSAELFVVGGAVRDAIIRRKTKDIDLVVRNVGLRSLERTLRSLGSVELVGRTFGVLKWTPQGWKGEQVDVALPRTDHALGTGGYKDVRTQSDPRLPLQEDLKRRDYTVNALAYNLKSGSIVDIVGGLSDIAAERLATVGEPHERFHEDYSRMLRGLRLSAELGFQLDARVAKITRIMMFHLQDTTQTGEWVVPRETIAREMIRMFVADPLRAFDICFYHNVFAILMPEVLDMQGCPQPKQYHVEGDVLQHTRLAIERMSDAAFKKRFGNEPSALLIFAILLHDIGKPVTVTFPAPDSDDRIRYNEHDSRGAAIARDIATRLHLSVYPKQDERRHVDAEDLAWLVKHHLVGFRNTIEHMRPATIEKYFYHPERPSRDLLQLQYVDSAATVGQGKKADMSGYMKIERVVRNISKTRNKIGIRPLLTGHDIMELLAIPPGPAIGTLLEALRDAQLRGSVKSIMQARTYLKRIYRAL